MGATLATLVSFNGFVFKPCGMAHSVGVFTKHWPISCRNCRS
jgi:hypothetical protein